ncbi:MAG: endonuclease/exonuclease/phosphatase family protein [Bacteroidales bacterium]|nr:endonuclease/exonuclease/phosphatase family protein [Bacteroidales bacterium]
MNAFLRFLHSFILTINVGIVILLIICGYAYKIKPEYSILSTFLGYGFPILAFLNLFFIFYWLFRWKVWVLISLIGAAITYSSYWAWFPINPTVETQSENPIKVLSYNVMYFSFKMDSPSGEIHPILDYIQKTDADIVCLQEAGSEFVNETACSEVGRKALKAYPYIYSGAKENRYSVVLLSKYPAIRFKRIKYESKSNSSFLYDLKIGGDTIRLINNHLESNKLNSDEKDKYTEFLKKRESEQLTEVAEVLGSKVGSASFIRANQADSISKVVKESPYPVILCGDFNDVPGSYSYRTVRKGLLDSWVENGNGWGNTFHENLFLFRIDFIMHSPDIKSYLTKVDKVKYSDHYPIWANLEIK